MDDHDGATGAPASSPHQWRSQVRDYEVDGFGGVNAATYLNYMEEARKHFLATLGIHPFELMRQHDLGFVVGRYEVDYLGSLVGGDAFEVTTSMARVSRLRVEFTQTIHRLPDGALVVRCKNIGLPVDVRLNKPVWPPLLDGLLADFPWPPRTSARSIP